MQSPEHSSQLKVIATGISDLNEARYFSAMGAEWLGFDGSRLSIDEIRIMAEWVVGPRNFIEIDLPDDEFLHIVSETSSVHGVCTSAEIVIPDWFDGVVLKRGAGSKEPGAGIIIMSGVDGFDEVWKEISDADDIDSLSTEVNGIVIRCNPDIEQEIAFEQYDQVFEKVKM